MGDLKTYYHQELEIALQLGQRNEAIRSLIWLLSDNTSDTKITPDWVAHQFKQDTEIDVLVRGLAELPSAHQPAVRPFILALGEEASVSYEHYRSASALAERAARWNVLAHTENITKTALDNFFDVEWNALEVDVRGKFLAEWAAFGSSASQLK